MQLTRSSSLTFGQYLLQTGLVQKHDMPDDATLDWQDVIAVKQAMLRLGLIPEVMLNHAIADFQQHKQVDLSQYNARAVIMQHHLPERIAREYSCCVIAHDQNNYVVAMRNPSDKAVVDQLSEQLCGCVQPVLVHANHLSDHLNMVYRQSQQGHGDSHMRSGRTSTVSKALAATSITDSAAEALLHELILTASSIQASEIHIESIHEYAVVRFRLHNRLISHMHITPEIAVVLAQQVCQRAQLDTSATSCGRHGVFSLQTSDVPYYLKAAVLPTEAGQSVILRFLQDANQYADMAHWITDKAACRILQASCGTGGVTLIVGPRGSGKTTTQYTSIMQVEPKDKKVIAIEAEVESYLPGVHQVCVDTTDTTATVDVLRTCMRQHPDVLMLDFISDASVAEAALRTVRAHNLVLAAMEAENVSDAITQLLEWNLSGRMIASSVQTIIAQRVLRQLCPHCKSSHILSAADLAIYVERLPDWRNWVGQTIYEPVGCRHCHQTGYKGYVPIYEALVVDKSVQHLLRSSALGTIHEALTSRLQGRDLLCQAFVQLRAGKTTLAEVTQAVF